MLCKPRKEEDMKITREVVSKLNMEKNLSFRRCNEEGLEMNAMIGHRIDCGLESGLAVVEFRDDIAVFCASNEKIEFDDCRLLFSNTCFKSIDFDGVDTSNITSMDGMFQRACIHKINFSNLDTSSVSSMRGMFELAYVGEITGDLDTSRVKDMAGMFAGMSTASGVLDLNRLDTSNVEDMESMFFHCFCSEIKIDTFNTSQVQNMKEMFFECKAITLDLSNFNVGDGTNIESIFRDCAAYEMNRIRLNESFYRRLLNVCE